MKKRTQTPVIQRRDLRLFLALHEYRYLSTSQIKAAYFSAGSFVYRRLDALTTHHYLARIRRNQIGTSSELLFSLGPKGAQALAEETGQPAAHFRTHRAGTISFVEHEYMLSTLRRQFEQAAETHNLALRWDVGRRLVLPDPNAPLIPDAALTLKTPQGGLAFYLEADRSTEAVQTVFRDKIERYAAYFAHQNERGRRFRVLIVTLDASARTALLKGTQSIAPASIFYFAALADLEGQPIWTAPLWHRADTPNQTHMLLPVRA